MGFFSIFKESTVLYFPGCYTYFKYREIFELYKKIFSKLGIGFKIIDKKICCGLSALESGYESEARKLARRNFEIFKEEKIAGIVTNSPCCYRMFLLEYKKFFPEWNIETKNIWRIILERLEEKPSLIKIKTGEEIAYQDSCYLGRYCDIYEEPRKILELLGCVIKEIPDSMEETICCGSCGGLLIANPKLADEIAKERILQAKRSGIKKIATASVADYELIKRNSEGTGIEVLELSEVLAIALKLKKEEVNGIRNNYKDKILAEAEANLRIEEELNDENLEFNKMKEDH